MRIYFRGRGIEISVRRLAYFEMGRGLMFRSQEVENLLFDFDVEGRRMIHSFFVFFPFLALWLDSGNNVVEWRIIRPFRFSVRPSRQFRKLIEIPFNERNKKVINLFVKG